MNALRMSPCVKLRVDMESNVASLRRLVLTWLFATIGTELPYLVSH